MVSVPVCKSLRCLVNKALGLWSVILNFLYAVGMGDGGLHVLGKMDKGKRLRLDIRISLEFSNIWTYLSNLLILANLVHPLSKEF